MQRALCTHRCTDHSESLVQSGWDRVGGSLDREVEAVGEKKDYGGRGDGSSWREGTDRGRSLVGEVGAVGEEAVAKLGPHQPLNGPRPVRSDVHRRHQATLRQHQRAHMLAAPPRPLPRPTTRAPAHHGSPEGFQGGRCTDTWLRACLHPTSRILVKARACSENKSGGPFGALCKAPRTPLKCHIQHRSFGANERCLCKVPTAPRFQPSTPAVRSSPGIPADVNDDSPSTPQRVGLGGMGWPPVIVLRRQV